MVEIADVVFAEATPRQRQLSWEVNGASWAPPLSIEEYLGRELTLSETTLSRDGGTHYYVLHLKLDPETIVSACEVTSKKGLVATGGAVREVDTYAIASVFTPPAFRGAGLATHLLRQVQAAVDTAGCSCGALYSDIGRVFYTRLGWRDFRSPQLLLRLEPTLNLASLPVSEPKTVPLDDGAIEALCEADTARLRAKFDKLATSSDGKTHFTFLPSYTQMAWHFARDTYVAGVLPPAEGQQRGSGSRGARTADGAAWLYWDHDLREKKLKVMRVVLTRSGSEGTQDARALLLAAVTEAKNWGLPKVLVWSPGTELIAAATSLWDETLGGLAVILEEREDGSIPSLRWKEGAEMPGPVVWEDDEYYAWC